MLYRLSVRITSFTCVLAAVWVEPCSASRPADSFQFNV